MTDSVSLEALKERLFKSKAPEGILGAVTKGRSEEVIPVRVTTVTRADYEDIITSFGIIKGFGEIPIKFKESGMIAGFYFKEGDEIESGEIVVSQDQNEENLRFEYAEIEYIKHKKLYDLGAITKDALRQRELEVTSTELDIKKRSFHAPSDGIMGTRKVNEGELVEPNDVVATFLDITNVFCEVGIIEKDIGKVKVGQAVKITLDRFPDAVFVGAVDSVSPMIEGRSRTQTVRILIPNDKSVIKPGMFARSEITTFKKKNALVVPRKTLKKTEDGYVVFGVIRQGISGQDPGNITARTIPVKVERASEDLALILEGLKEGQEIVLESPRAKETIKDGVRIEIIEE